MGIKVCDEHHVLSILLLQNITFHSTWPFRRSTTIYTYITIKRIPFPPRQLDMTDFYDDDYDDLDSDSEGELSAGDGDDSGNGES